MTAINELIEAVLTAHPEDGRMRALAMEARAALENPGASQAMPLTDEQIDELNYIEVVREDYEVFSLDQKSVRDFAREVIAEFCRITTPEGKT